MKSLRLITLDDTGRRIAQATFSFFLNRLAEADTVEWAVRLSRTDEGQRAGILQLLDRNDGRRLREPWRTAWRTIEESWSSHTPDLDAGMGAHEVKVRLVNGELSGALIEEIVDLVAPTLAVAPFSSFHREMHPRLARIRTIRDLFLVQINSGRGLDAENLGLNEVTDETFLIALATALESAVLKGLDIARRLGAHGKSRLWMAGQLHRVYFVPPAERAADRDEPDHFHEGIAPSVKLLFATVTRLAALRASAALQFVRRWRLWDSPVHVRLWAAAARDATLASPTEVTDFLLGLDTRIDWDVLNYPEVAELRARRFRELDAPAQAKILARLRKGPARTFWRGRLTAEQMSQARISVIARELSRIEAGGAALPPRDLAWLDRNAPPGVRHQHVAAGFLGGERADWVGEEPDHRFDELLGVARLEALETALASPRVAWNEDPASAATAWVRHGDNVRRVLDDLEASRNIGAPYPHVWNQFGWTHVPRNAPQDDADSDAQVARVLALLSVIAEPVLRAAIEGLSNWFYSWSSPLASSADTLPVWLRLWPLAVAATDNRDVEQATSELDSVVRADTDSEAMALDTLNTAVGKLMQVFLRGCPDLAEIPHPFVQDPLRTMRERITDTHGRAGLIARYRLIEEVGYFHNADPEWTEQNLLIPLRADSADALQLWRALGLRIHSHDVLKVIGKDMTERAVDMRLGRDTREVLASNLVIEGLYAIKLDRPPAVPFPRIQQTLRSVEDEVRAHAADTLRRFVSELSAREDAQLLMRTVAIPFLHRVWPQERSLSTPGVSRALADLPATAFGAFAEAVEAIERFLVPFDCWAMHDFGLHASNEDDAQLLAIDSPEKAKALLILLDRTVGTTESAVVPYDIGTALDRIRAIQPQLALTPSFRRLAAASRRS